MLKDLFSFASPFTATNSPDVGGRVPAAIPTPTARDEGTTALQTSARNVGGSGDIDPSKPRRTQRSDYDRLQDAQEEIARLNEAFLNERDRRREERDRRREEKDRRLEEERRGREHQISAESYKGQLEIVNQQYEAAQSELEALRGLLSTYDDTSAEEVTGLLKDINDRIEEIACDNANRWLFETPPKKSSRAVPLTEGVYRELEQILGPAFAATLWSTPVDRGCALFLLQSAWQACIVEGVRAILEAFSPRSVAHKFDSPLLRLGQAICEGESQPIYGRWRALTHRYLRLGASEDEDTIMKLGVQKTARGCYEIALLLFQTAELDSSEFYATFEAGLEEVFTKGLRLGMTIRERVISSNYRPLAPSIASLGGFDELTMVATEADSVPPAGSEVLCTIRLGMTSTSKQGRERTGTNVDLVFRQAEVLTKLCLDESIRN